MNAPLGPAGRGRRVVVLRHGVTQQNADGIWQGHLDSELTAEGMDQARRAAPAVASYEPDIVVSSDLLRARVTAETVLERVPGRALRIDERLREIHVGQWQGLERRVLLERFPEAAGQMSGLADFRRGGDGETYAECADRAGLAVADLLDELEDGRTALIVTHGVVARAIVGDLLGLDRDTSWAVLAGLGNCHWAEIVEYGAVWQCRGWGLSAGFGSPGPIR